MHVRSRVLILTIAFLCAASITHSAVPVHQWSRGVGGTGNDLAYAVVIDGAGNVIITGRFQGSVDFGGGALTSTDNQDVVLAKYDATGAHLWSKAFGGTYIDEGYGVTVDGSNNVIITGHFYTTIDFGGGVLTSTGPDDIFLAKFDPNGAHLWSKRFGSGSAVGEDGFGVAADAAGDIALCGAYTNGTDFGGGPLSAVGANDVFVAKFDASGTHQWSKGFGSIGSDLANACTIDATGSIAMTGYFGGTVDFGGGPLTTAGSIDIFVARFDASGSHLWSRRAGALNADSGQGIAFDASGAVSVTGLFRGTVDFGGGPLVAPGNNDIFVARYDAGGAHVWSHVFGGATGNDIGQALASNAAGYVVIAGQFGSTIDFGGGPLTAADGGDVFMAAFDAAGTHQWSRRFGSSPSADVALGVALDQANHVALTGYSSGPINFGGSTLGGAGSTDTFLARFEVDSPIPVLFSRFDATARDQAAIIEWRLWSDESLDRFTLYRRDHGTSHSIAVAAGAASATGAFTDRSVAAGKTYDYELVIRSRDGSDFRSPMATVQMPQLRTSLAQNYPNPFNPRTSIAFTLADASRVTLDVFDVSGRRVASLMTGVRPAGRHTIDFDASSLSSGVYSYRLVAGDFSKTRKMVLLK